MISGKNSGVVTMPTVFMATCDVTLDVIPQTGGYLPFPEVKLKSYEWPVDGTQHENILQDESSSESCRAVVSTKEPPVVKPFKCGQVYNVTQAIQVLVLPSNADRS